MPVTTQLFKAIPSTDLVHIQGGAARVTARSNRSNDDLGMVLTQVTDSIKDRRRR